MIKDKWKRYIFDSENVMCQEDGLNLNILQINIQGEPTVLS